MVEDVLKENEAVEPVSEHFLQFKTSMVYIYKTGNIQVWRGEILLYEGPSFEMAKASTIPF